MGTGLLSFNYKMKTHPKIKASMIGSPRSKIQIPPQNQVGPLKKNIRRCVSSPDSIINDHDPASPSSSLVIGDPLMFGDDGSAKTLSTNSSFVSNESAAKKSKAQKFKTVDELNWSDRNELLLNRSLFESSEVRLFELADTKRTEYPNGFDRGNYFENLPLIIASRFVRAEKIVCCGNYLKGKPVPCDQWQLCSKCAYVCGIRASEMYAGTFGKSTFYHVTLGFDGDIDFDVTNCIKAQDYWKTNRAAVAHLLSHDLIRGAYLVHELKIRSFLPLRVNPHSYVIVSASQFPDEVKATMEEMIAGAAGVNLKPSIEVKLIDSQTYHDKGIRYLTKAMDLQEPYLSAWREHCSSGRKRAPELNLEMRIFLDAQAAAFGGMDKVVRIGNLMPQRKSFIGVKAADRKPKKRGETVYRDTRTIINRDAI